jgi:hypothetical protein
MWILLFLCDYNSTTPSKVEIPRVKSKVADMTADQYLRAILARERVDTSVTSPLLLISSTLEPMLFNWAGRFLLRVEPSGSFAKGTANKSSTDIDLFLTLSSETPNTLEGIRSTLKNYLLQHGYEVRDQNVSLGVKIYGHQVDLVPAKRQSQYGNDHSLFQRKANTWTKTNIHTHIAIVKNSGRTEEIRILKLWRDQRGLNFPSIYLELATLEALHGKPVGQLSANVANALRFFESKLSIARIVDPANSNNVISDGINAAEKQWISATAKAALAGTWAGIVR